MNYRGIRNGTAILWRYRCTFQLRGLDLRSPHLAGPRPRKDHVYDNPVLAPLLGPKRNSRVRINRRYAA